MTRRNTIGLGVAGVVCVVALWAVARRADAGDQPWAAPESGVVLSRDGSMAHIEWRGQPIMLFAPGMRDSSNRHVFSREFKTFDYSGTLAWEGAEDATYVYRSASPDRFTVNGKVFELSGGRVFVVGTGGAVEQCPFCPLKASHEYAVVFRDYLARRGK